MRTGVACIGTILVLGVLLVQPANAQFNAGWIHPRHHPSPAGAIVHDVSRAIRHVARDTASLLGARRVCTVPVVAVPTYSTSIYGQSVYGQTLYGQSVYTQPVYSSPVFSSQVYTSSGIYSQPTYARTIYTRPMVTTPIYGTSIIHRGMHRPFRR